VVHQGVVAESGTHEELLSKKGRYMAMWNRQIRAEEVAREAQVLSDRAKILAKESITRPNSREGKSGENSDAEDGRPGAVVRFKESVPSVSGTLNRAADGLRGAVGLFHGGDNDDSHSGKPAGHP
jgi:hypothetical protein